MPIDKATADAMTGTFRNMYNEVIEKNATGEAVDRMKKYLDRMEQLAEELSDIGEYSAKLATENVFVEFSNAYSQVLSDMAKQEYANKEITDDELMRNSIKAYEDAITRLEDTPDADKLIPPIQEVITVAKSGITFPVFLRMCEEKGYNQLIQGGAVTRRGLEMDVEFNRMFKLPLDQKKYQTMLDKFDELAAKAPFGTPDSFEFGLHRIKIEWDFEPSIIKWNAVRRCWEKLMEIMLDWIDSYCSFAPYDERWADMRGMTYTLRNIKRTKECAPGIFKQREKLLSDYFGMTWDDIWSHETYINEYNANRVWYSDIVIDLFKRLYPLCKPFSNPTQEMIDEEEKYHKEKLCIRKERFHISEEDKKRFIALFGQKRYDDTLGEMERKYGKDNI